MPYQTQSNCLSIQPMPSKNMFSDYLTRWNLIPDGDPIKTNSSQLLPVRYHTIPAMLKIALIEEECRGNALMAWWSGVGSVPVLAYEGKALLMERARCNKSLIEIAMNCDDEASRIICQVANILHVPKDNPPPLVSLSEWFKDLGITAIKYGGIFNSAYTIATELLNAPEDIVVLHGDIHHGNILNFVTDNWRAIDPKGLIGERGFDFANLFCNPNMSIASSPQRLIRQLDIVASTAKLNPNRLLKWIVAYAGLSASWTLLETNEYPELALCVISIAISELAKRKC